MERDADWAQCKDTRRSRTGWIYTRSGGAISWRSRLQTDGNKCGVSISSAEAEYKALSEVIQEGMYLRQLEQETKVNAHIEPTVILEDNQACIKIANNKMTSQRTKHIDIRYHFSRERIAAKQFILQHVSTLDNVADIFTKPLDGAKLRKFMVAMGMEGDEVEDAMKIIVILVCRMHGKTRADGSSCSDL